LRKHLWIIVTLSSGILNEGKEFLTSPLTFLHMKDPRLGKEDYAEVMVQIRRMSREQRIRLLLLEKFGSRCKKCGNNDYRVLQLDHVRNNRGEERKKFKNIRTVYRNILDGILPKEDYQLLCANCNWIKRFDCSP